jgi:hypothetical protein
MSDVEFVGRMNPQPFKSLAAIEKERLLALKLEIERNKLKKAGKLSPEPIFELTREPAEFD